MTTTAGITQSVNRAARLLRDTGLFDSSRGLHTEAWQRNLRESVRELREAARSLVRPDNRAAYGELSQAVRLELWRAILLARAVPTGCFIIGRLGARYPAMTDHVRRVERELTRVSKGFSNGELHYHARRILNASPDPETAVEQRAAAAGDPAPEGITTSEAELYQRIFQQAIRHADREASSHRNAGEAAMEAFGESWLPPVMPDARFVDELEGKGLEATLGEEAGRRAGLALGLFRAIHDAAGAHYRHENAQYRLNWWIREVCLRESNGDQGQADQLLRRLQDIKRRMDAWLAWLERHHDHPDHVSPHGEWQASPTASLSPSGPTRPGQGNRAGPVQGAVRGATGRGPAGLA